MRDRFRSSAMHNTLVIDGRSQSLPSGPFGWSSRADGCLTRWESTADREVAAGRHNGYAPIVHSREVTAVHGLGWTIVDRVEGPGPTTATVLWHFHPAWSLIRIDSGRATLHHADGTRLVFMSSAPVGIATAPGLDEYAPEYGRIERALCLEASVSGATPISIVTVIPADGTVEAARQLASSVHLPKAPMTPDPRTPDPRTPDPGM